jgi:hypothetical protein
VSPITFEWDDRKNLENFKKHGVSFEKAQDASELDIGERGKENMKSRIKYSAGPIGKYRVISDFLPTPEQLVKKETNVKVTINLRKDSVDFFKTVAKKNNIQYQKVIRGLLNSYADSYAHNA